MRVRKIATEDLGQWSQVGPQQIFVNDVVDAGTEPAAQMTVGFARLAKGETLEISFPYDEVLILTKGSYTVTTPEGETLTARAGEAIYLPGGSSNSSRAEEEAEMVYVAAPPSVYAEHVAQSAG